MPTLIVDGGNLGDDPAKRAVIVEAMGKMGYAACFARQTEIHSLAGSLKAAGVESVPAFDPNRPTSAFWSGECGGVRVAIARVDPEPVAGKARWQETLERAATQIQQQSDFAIVISRLSHGTQGVPDDTVSLARRFGSAGSVQTIIVTPAAAIAGLPKKEAGVLLCPSKDRGQTITVLDAVGTEDRQWTVTGRLEPVTSAYAPEAEVQGLVNAYYHSRQTALVTAPADAPLSEAAYAPAKSCKPCHAEAYAIWEKSAHARAVETLREKQRLVPECLTCHSEHFRRGGRLDLEEESDSDGVQCSTCHGDGIVHTLTRGEQTLSRERTCVECHNEEHDPEFNLEGALKAIKHWR